MTTLQQNEKSSSICMLELFSLGLPTDSLQGILYIYIEENFLYTESLTLIRQKDNHFLSFCFTTSSKNCGRASWRLMRDGSFTKR